MRKWMTIALLACSSLSYAEAPKIAVADLCYQERVREHFSYFEAHEKHDSSGSATDNYRDGTSASSGSSSARFKDKGESSVIAASGTVERISIGELRKFTGDIRGGLIKAGYRVMQGKPWTQKNSESVYDIIKRIKDGYYPGADYVLFGTVSQIELARNDNPIQGSSAISHTLSMDLVAEFSLINTKTYEIVAGFSAEGQGADTKISNSPASMLTLNVSRATKEVSQSLGDAVVEEVAAQFPL